MRYFLLFLLIIVLAGCKFQAWESDPVIVPPPTAVPTPSPTITVSPSPPTAVPTQSPTITVSPLPPTPIATPSPNPVEQTTQAVEPIWSYRITSEYPHDSSAYTQGLVTEEGLVTLLEGTGRDSSLRRVDLQTGTIDLYIAVPEYFGEGITLFEDRIIQLTWQSQVGFIYDSETFEQIGEFYYPHQGWGLTHDGSELIVSDGTDVIRFWDPETFKEVRRIEFVGVNGHVTKLNEL